MFDKVFISYASEDFEIANKLFTFLEESGLDPWLDKKKILPGQNWEEQIIRALKSADFIIILLSTNSVTKRGYVQKEFRRAIDFFEEKLDSDIYIIPFKLDNCVVPEKFGKLQWVDFGDADCYQKLALSLNEQRARYRGDMSIHKYETKKEREFIKGTPNLVIELEYPCFNEKQINHLKEVNEYLKGYLLKESIRFKNTHIDFAGNVADYRTSEYNPSDYFLQTAFKVHLVSTQYLSLTIFQYDFQGGAHGNYFDRGFNFRLNPLLIFSLGDLFEYDNDILSWLSEKCKIELIRIASGWLEIDTEDEVNSIFQDTIVKGTRPEWNNFDNFYLTSESIVIIFSIYQVGPYAFGQHEIKFSFKKLMEEIKLTPKFIDFVKCLSI
jgi:hypothetical protein